MGHVWRTGIGKVVALSNMDKDHIKNVISYITRFNQPKRKYNGATHKEWKARFIKELKKREPDTRAQGIKLYKYVL